MDSIDITCTPLKQEYDQCFNKWYSEKFLNGQWNQKDGSEPCAELFKKYNACVTVRKSDLISFRRLMLISIINLFCVMMKQWLHGVFLRHQH